jgi:hypothetical protein
MLTIECICGKEICLVPDLKAMSFAINRHVNTHRQEERERIEEHLVSEAFVKITSIDPSLWDKISACPY